MSTYECSISNPKKQLEFYKQLSEQLQVENQELKIQISAREEVANKYKEVIDKAIKLLESQIQDMMGNYFFDDNIAEQLLVILKEVE